MYSYYPFTPWNLVDYRVWYLKKLERSVVTCNAFRNRYTRHPTSGCKLSGIRYPRPERPVSMGIRAPKLEPAEWPVGTHREVTEPRWQRCGYHRIGGPWPENNLSSASDITAVSSSVDILFCVHCLQTFSHTIKPSTDQ